MSIWFHSSVFWQSCCRRLLGTLKGNKSDHLLIELSLLTHHYYQDEEMGRMITCEESPSDISLTLRKLTDELLSNETTASSALDQLSTITNDRWNQPNAVELYEAARLLHLSVEQLEISTVNQFQSVSQTISLVYRQLF